MSKNPFFNSNLILTNASGEYYGVRSTLRLVVDDDALTVGGTRVPYADVIAVSSDGDRLFVQFADETGKICEKYLKYNTFLPSSASKRLSKLAAFAKIRIPKAPRHELQRNQAIATQPVSLKDGTEVTIHSSQVSFPTSCPVCFAPASNIAKLEVTAVVPSMDFLKIGYWLVPVCHMHKKLVGAISVKNWSPTCKEIHFTFKNPSYADAFCKLNQMPLHNRNSREANVVERIRKLKQFKFVIYEYYVSLVVVGFQGQSDVQQLSRVENSFLRGLKYNAITLTAGWWSFPMGPIFSFLVLAKNFMGGIDVSSRVAAVFEGKPFSALND